MASGNPTLDAANAETGIEPLNAGPTEPQIPQQAPDKDDNIPASLASLPAGCRVVVFPLSLDEKKDSRENVASLPHERQLETLVKAVVRPEGPSRAELVETGTWEDKYSDILEKLREVVDGGEVKFYRLQTGKNKAEGYLVGLDRDSERMLAIRVMDLEG